METALYQLQLLAPHNHPATASYRQVRQDTALYESHMSSMQLLRGRTYSADGAVQPDQLDDMGRLPMCQDDYSWHLLLVNTKGEVVGCVRYLIHSPTVRAEDLYVNRSALAASRTWANALRYALDAELKFARDEKLAFIEVGGWAVAAEYRHTRAALEVLIASFAFARVLGGAIGCCTATVRNNSASILRRIGATSLTFGDAEIPPYKDSRYGCTMELLRFHFECFDLRYRKIVDDMQCRMVQECSVITPSHRSPSSLTDFETQNSLQALSRALEDAQAVLAPVASV